MDKILSIISEHAHHAHWYVFIALVLAGLNIPICIDLLVLVSAFLAAVIIPENTLFLFLSCLLGCSCSAWLAYWVGRLLGPKLCKMRYISRLINVQRLQKMKSFYDKYGMRTLILGRFIPFGVRNCIFMSSGMSKVHFGKFVLMDALACSIWCSIAFSIFYFLGQNYQIIWEYVKTFNLFLFAAFSVTVIAYLWYKSKKKAKTSKLPT